MSQAKIRTVPSPLHVSVQGIPAAMPLYALFVNITTAWEHSGASRAMAKVEQRMMDAF